MTNAREDFSLDAELDETAGWDLEDDEDGRTTSRTRADDDGWESGYADDDPELALGELTAGEQDLAERYALRRVAGL